MIDSAHDTDWMTDPFLHTSDHKSHDPRVPCNETQRNVECAINSYDSQKKCHTEGEMFFVT